MNKRRKREKVRTVLIACEGQDDEEFLKFLKGVWHMRYSGHVVRTFVVHGGGVKQMVEKTLSNPAESSERYLLLDQFTVDKERGFHVPQSISLIKSDPCLEAMICCALESGRTFEGMSERDCKRYLKETYTCDGIARKWLEQNMTERVLERAAKKIPCVKKIQQILQGGV